MPPLVHRSLLIVSLKRVGMARHSLHQEITVSSQEKGEVEAPVGQVVAADTEETTVVLMEDRMADRHLARTGGATSCRRLSGRNVLSFKDYTRSAVTLLNESIKPAVAKLEVYIV